MATDIGSRIKKFRKEKNWTQAELGEVVGIDKRNVSRYEAGGIEPRKKTLKKFAEALEVEVDDLLGLSHRSEDIFSEDPEFFELVKEVADLPEGHKQALIKIMTVMVREHRIQSAIAS